MQTTVGTSRSIPASPCTPGSFPCPLPQKNLTIDQWSRRPYSPPLMGRSWSLCISAVVPMSAAQHRQSPGWVHVGRQGSVRESISQGLFSLLTRTPAILSPPSSNSTRVTALLDTLRCVVEVCMYVCMHRDLSVLANAL